MFSSLSELGDLRQLLDVGQMAGGIGLADAAGDGAMFGEGVLEREAHHGVSRGLIGEGGEVAAQRRVGIPAVEVIGVDDREGCVHGIACAEDGMGGAPRLFTADWNREAGGQLVDRLEGKADFDPAGELRGDAFAEILLEVRTDDEDHLAEASAESVEHRVVQDGLAGGAHRVDLLESTVAATHAGGEDEEGGFHVRGVYGCGWSRRL